MFNHVGHLTLVPEATDAQIDAQIVRDAGLVPGNANLRFQMRFDSEAAWQA